MKFEKIHKKIIKAISKGDIDDLTTFVHKFCSESEVKIDEKEINGLKQADFSEEKLKTILDFKRQFPSLSFETGRMEEISDIENSLRNTSINRNVYQVNLNIVPEHTATINALDLPIFSVGMELIEAFLTVWNFLEDENLIFIREKTLSDTDLAIFVKAEKMRNTPSYQESIINLATNKVIYEPKMYIRDIEYGGYILSENKELIDLCKNHIDKQLLITSKIRAFVRQNFSTSDIYGIKLSWVAIVIAVLSIIASVVVPLGDVYNQEKYRSQIMQNIENQSEILETISDKLEEIVGR